SGNRSLGFAVASCTGGVSGDGAWDESVGATSAIGCCSTGPAVVLVSVTVGAAVAIAALPTPASPTAVLPIAPACGASASCASAARDDVRRPTIGATPVLLMAVEPRPASQAIAGPAKTTANAAATVANRRGFEIAAFTAST